MDDRNSKSLSTPALLTVVLASGWSFLAFLCWFSSATAATEVMSPGWLTTIALASCVVTAVYRFAPVDLQLHSTWQQVRSPLALCAGINWLGFILIRSPELLAAIPALFVLAASEAGIYIHGCLADHRNDLTSSPSVPAGGALVTTAQKIGPEHLEQLLAKELDAPDETASLGGQDPEAQPLEQGIEHQQRTGKDDTGNRFTAGEVFVHFSEGERARQVVIGFQPAFSGIPNVEIESEDGDVTAEVQNCTPSGMRLLCKLNRSAAADTSTVVAFYVTQSLAGEPADPQQAPSSPNRTVTALP